MLEEYEVEREQLEADVLRLATNWQSAGWLCQLSDPPCDTARQ